MEATATKTATWALDDVHSEIGFSVRHMVIAKVSGKFEDFSAQIKTEGDTFENASVVFSAKVGTINTGKADRDGHLKSDDFFNAEQYPDITFRSITMTKTAEDIYTLTGELTIRDVTKEITLTAEHGGTITDPYGNERAGFHLRGKINRFDFGLQWNALLETGGAVVGDTITLDIDAEIVKEG